MRPRIYIKLVKHHMTFLEEQLQVLNPVLQIIKNAVKQGKDWLENDSVFTDYREISQELEHATSVLYKVTSDILVQGLEDGHKPRKGKDILKPVEKKDYLLTRDINLDSMLDVQNPSSTEDSSSSVSTSEDDNVESLSEMDCVSSVSTGIARRQEERKTNKHVEMSAYTSQWVVISSTENAFTANENDSGVHEVTSEADTDLLTPKATKQSISKVVKSVESTSDDDNFGSISEVNSFSSVSTSEIKKRLRDATKNNMYEPSYNATQWVNESNPPISVNGNRDSGIGDNTSVSDGTDVFEETEEISSSYQEKLYNHFLMRNNIV